MGENLSDKIWSLREFLARRLVHLAKKLDDEIGFDINRANYAEEILCKAYSGELEGAELKAELYAYFY